MKSAETKYGRIFSLSLETGDRIPESIETFAKENHISNGLVHFVGCLYNGSIVTGPEKTGQMPPKPVRQNIEEAHDALALGIIAPNAEGEPILHIHGSLGRIERAVTGCLRVGIDVWLTGEVILQEIVTDKPIRLFDEKSKFALLDISE